MQDVLSANGKISNSTFVDLIVSAVLLPPGAQTAWAEFPLEDKATMDRQIESLLYIV